MIMTGRTSSLRDEISCSLKNGQAFGFRKVVKYVQQRPPQLALHKCLPFVLRRQTGLGCVPPQASTSKSPDFADNEEARRKEQELLQELFFRHSKEREKETQSLQSVQSVMIAKHEAGRQEERATMAKVLDMHGQQRMMELRVLLNQSSASQVQQQQAASQEAFAMEVVKEDIATSEAKVLNIATLSDWVEQFADFRDTNAFTSSEALYQSYSQFCSRQDLKPACESDFVRYLVSANPELRNEHRVLNNAEGNGTQILGGFAGIAVKSIVAEQAETAEPVTDTNGTVEAYLQEAEQTVESLKS